MGKFLSPSKSNQIKRNWTWGKNRVIMEESASSTNDVVNNENKVVENLPFLKNLEHVLCCPICHEYMQTPVLSITCSHNFCSLCIRKYVTLRNKCPVCSAEVSSGVLRPNRVLEEIILYYKPLKALLVERKIIDACDEIDQTIPVTTTQVKERDSPPKKKSPFKKFSPLKRPLKLSQITKKQPANSSECPICLNVYANRFIGSHVEACMKISAGAAAVTVLPGTSQQSLPVVSVRKTLPKLVYSIMKDTEIRARLKNLDLSAKGDRTTLINRHKAFTILYNAECDALEPRPVGELMNEMIRNEAVERQLAIETRTVVQRKEVDLEAIEKKNRQYLTDNKESFRKLVEEIRKRLLPLPTPSTAPLPLPLAPSTAPLPLPLAPSTPPLPLAPSTPPLPLPLAPSIAPLPLPLAPSTALLPPTLLTAPLPLAPSTAPVRLAPLKSSPQPRQSPSYSPTSPTPTPPPVIDDDEVEILENVPKPVKNIIEVTLDDEEESPTPSSSIVEESKSIPTIVSVRDRVTSSTRDGELYLQLSDLSRTIRALMPVSTPTYTSGSSNSSSESRRQTRSSTSSSTPTSQSSKSKTSEKRSSSTSSGALKRRHEPESSENQRRSSLRRRT